MEGTPRWGLLAAIATSVSGGVIGVLWAILIASNGHARTLPEGSQGAHPATMVVGFLVPLGMALVEWWLRPDAAVRRGTRAGFIQMALLFTGGFTLMLGMLLDAMPLMMLNLPFEIVAVVIFLVRNWRSLRAVRWAEPSTERFMAAGSIAIVLNVGMLVYLISRYADDFEQTPAHRLLALDHVMFIGVMTNCVFGLMLAAMSARRASLAWADQAIFLCVNVGIAGFWLGLLTGVVWLERVFTPIMGIGILLGISVYLLRARSIAAEPRLETTRGTG